MSSNNIGPWSGNVPITQTLNPMNWVNAIKNGQFGIITNINGRSSSHEMEQEILDKVGTYGRQLNKLHAVVRILVEDFPKEARDALPAEKQKALRHFEHMMEEIDDLKEEARKRPASCPYAKMFPWS